MKKRNKKIKIAVIHGPNLNLLGEREPELYGKITLREINNTILKFTKPKSIKVKIFQSNHEGEIINFIHRSRKKFNGILINPGAYTHYSYSIRDAISAVSLPAVEVHLTDIRNREDFRSISVISPVCIDQICGLGVDSYLKGIKKIEEYLE